MLRKILSLCLVAALTVGFSLLGAATETRPNEALYIGSQSTEKKVFSTATLDDDFADDYVIVVIKKHSQLNLSEARYSGFSRDFLHQRI